MRTYTVPLKIEEEETEVRHGVLAVPEAMMGKDPVYVYYDEDCDEFFPSKTSPETMKTTGPYNEYIVTLWPRDKAHLHERFAEVVAFHRGQDLTRVMN